MRALRCTITNPSGDVLEATPLLEIGSVSVVTFAPEDDLGVMTHGDMELDLDDSGGVVRSFLGHAQPLDVYEVILERQDADGPGWNRVFGGVLDIRSLVFDHKDKTATITAWSYSKLMEQTPADTIKRTLATKTASINSGSRTLSFLADAEETSDIVAGDVVKLTDAQGNEGEFVIDSILSATQALATKESDETLTDCLVVVTTPYYRDKTPAQVAALIAAELGMELDASDFDSDLASYPILTPLVISGGSSSAQPISLVPVGTTIVASYDSADSTKRRVCSGPSTPWTLGATDNDYQRDWTPYLLTEPATIYERTPGTWFPVQYDSNTQSNNRIDAHIVAECVAYTAGRVSVAGDKWSLYADYHQVAGDQTARLSVYLNGVSHLVLEDVTSPGFPGDLPYWCGWIDWDTESDVLWLSYQMIPDPSAGNTEPTIRKMCMLWWSVIGGTPQLETVESDKSGQVRFCKGLGPNGHLLFYDCPISLETGTAGSGTLRFYDATSAAGLLGETLDATVSFALGYPQLWTARYWNGYLVFLFQQGDAVRIALYDASAFATTGPVPVVPFVAAYTVADKIQSYRCYLTIMTLTSNRTIVAGYAGGEWFVLSLRYDGVIRYADFEDMSCAEAAAQLALVTNSIVNVDVFRTLSLANRRGLGRGDVIRDLGTPIEYDERIVSEVWRSSVQVTGRLTTGGEISIVLGDQGDSANRLSIDLDLVTTTGMAVATGVATLQFVSAVRSQHDVVIPDDEGTPLAFGDRVRLGDLDLFVYKGQIDIEQGIQSLTLLGVNL